MMHRRHGATKPGTRLCEGAGAAGHAGGVESAQNAGDTPRLRYDDGRLAAPGNRRCAAK